MYVGMVLSPALVLPFITVAGIDVGELSDTVAAAYPTSTLLDLHLVLVTLDLRGLTSEDGYVVRRLPVPAAIS